MASNLNIDLILNKTWGNYNPKNKNTVQKSNSSNIDANIFAQASAVVAQYKSEEGSATKTKSTGNSFLGLTNTQIASMSTSDFLRYAYDNKAKSGFDEKSTDSTGIKLPMLVRYKGQVVCTAGKTFMAVVAKFKAKYPHRSEEEIAAELMSKYAGDSIQSSSTESNKKTAGNSVNLSA